MSVYFRNLLISGLGLPLNHPFKVEILPKVIVLLCFIGVYLLFSNFHGFLVVLKVGV